MPVRIRTSRLLGQNFLIDPAVLQRIVEHAAPEEEEVILEVGAGTGNLTSLLQQTAGRVVAIEKDSKLADQLRRKFQDKDNVKVIEGDVLKISPPPFDKVIADPPYNISSKLIFMFLRKPLKPMTMVFQREFALRLIAAPGSADYGRLTVALSHKAKTQLMDFVPRTAFRPTPRVDSCIIRIIPKSQVTPVDESFLDQMIRYLFSQRKKTLKAVLKRATSTTTRKSLNSLVKPADLLDKRIFQLTPSEFENISNCLSPQHKLFKFSNR